MPRIYVKNGKNKWNIYSTVVDNFLFDMWISFEELKQYKLDEVEEEMNSLLTDKPKLNFKTYEEIMRVYEPASKNRKRDVCKDQM